MNIENRHLQKNFDTNKWKSASLRTKDYRYFIDDKGDEILFDLINDKNENQEYCKR